MHGIELLPPGSDKESRGAWLALRRAGITASEIAVIDGTAPPSWPSAFAVWADKAGVLERDDAPTDAMRLGHALEPYVLGEFTARTGLRTGRLGLAAHPERMWQLCTPDAVTEEGCPVEAKTSGGFAGWGDDGSGTVPAHYEAQVRWQMDVLGAPRGYLACFFFPTRAVRVYEITADEAEAARLRAAAEAFLRRVRDGMAPPVDGNPATGRALKGIYRVEAGEEVVVSRALRLRYAAALRRRDEAERHARMIENMMRDALGTARAGIDAKTGEVCVTRSVYLVKEHVRRAAVVDRINYRRERE